MMATNSQPPTALKPAACSGNISNLNSEMLVLTSLLQRRRLETATKFHKRWLIYRLLAMSSLLLLILVPSEKLSLWNPLGRCGLPSSKRVHCPSSILHITPQIPPVVVPLTHLPAFNHTMDFFSHYFMFSVISVQLFGYMR